MGLAEVHRRVKPMGCLLRWATVINAGLGGRRGLRPAGRSFVSLAMILAGSGRCRGSRQLVLKELEGGGIARHRAGGPGDD